MLKKEPDQDSDWWAVEKKLVSLTPLRLGLTGAQRLDEMQPRDIPIRENA